MIYFYSPYYKNYEFMPNYAIKMLNEENNILLIKKDGAIYEQKKEKKVIHQMLEDKVLIKEDPQMLNIDTIIAKFYLREER